MIVPARFAANVAWLFTELPWIERFAAARSAGFEAVEFPWPADPDATIRAVRAAGVRVAMVNMPAGDLVGGERGWPNDPTRIEEWLDAFTRALDFADAVGCPTINVLAGNSLDQVARADQMHCLEANLRHALPMAAGAGVTLVSEVLNRPENPRYLLTTLDEAALLLRTLAPVGWRLQLDTYHLGRERADVAVEIRRASGSIGHVQIADVPGRHEPGTGALDWNAVAAALDAAGYSGPIGLEYVPSRGRFEPFDVPPAWRDADMAARVSREGRSGA